MVLVTILPRSRGLSTSIASARSITWLAVGLAWSIGSIASASSFDFKITGEGIQLPKPEVIREGPIEVKAEVGKTFTLIAQGRAFPRTSNVQLAIEGQPFEPEMGKWSFDKEAFQAVAIDPKTFDKTQIAIRLQPMTPGRTIVRFVGKVGGYDRAFEIRIEVAKGK